MADLILTPAPLLADLSHRTAGACLRTVPDLMLTAMAIPRKGKDAAEAALRSATGLALPAPGLSEADEGLRAIWLSPDQVLLMTPDAAPAALTGPFYTTDQTDAWVTLDLSGSACLPVLERLVMLDVATLAENAAARTLAAHLSVLLIRIAADRWWLMSAASSAKSFAESVTGAMDAASHGGRG